MADQQVFDDAGLDILCAAAGPDIRQVRAQGGEAGELPPLGLVPAIGAGDFAAVLALQESGHDLDLQAVGDVEGGVVLMRNGFREGRVVLGIDGQAGGLGQRGQHRLRQFAGRAIALNDGDPAGVGKL